MATPRPVVLSAALILFACGRVQESSGEFSKGDPVALSAVRWQVVDSSSVGVWWDPMIDSATVYRVRVNRGADSVDIDDVIGPLPQIVAGDTVLGLRLRRKGSDADRELFRVVLPNRRLTTWPLPSDVFSNFADVSIAPDGEYIAYVADAGDAIPEARVRRFPGGPVVIRGPRAAGCECDVDLSHARWVSRDSFEIAVINQAAPGDKAPEWLLTAGHVNPARQHTIGLRDEPTWHEP
ncbi:MAG TPA: hypothetical protein VN602_12890 [Gemmatimonadaceae bacterium]|nr:hypothetical protein [Gemmatimonadaceae bacterium]